MDKNAACDELSNRLKFLNKKSCDTLNEDLNQTLNNCITTCRNHFVFHVMDQNIKDHLITRYSFYWKLFSLSK